MQWSNVYVYRDGGNYLNFQIRLHETSNAIELAYGSCAAGRTNTAEVGLRGSDPSDFNARTGASWAASTASVLNTEAMPLRPGVVPPPGLHYTFTPPAPLPCARPFSVVAAERSGTTARLTWRTQGGSGPFEVVYGPAGFDPATATPVPASTNSLLLTNLTPLTSYEAYVTQVCGGTAGRSPRSAKGPFRTTLINDDPVGALPLPIGSTCQPVSATTLNATATSSTIAPGFVPQQCGQTQPADIRQDVWFTLTTPATGPASTGVILTATGTYAAAAQVRVFSSAGGAAGPFTPVFCALASPPTAAVGPVTVAPLQPGTTYYVVISSRAGFTTPGPFTLCATEPPNCSAPTALATTLNNSTATTAQLSFVPGNGATSYAVTYTPVGGGASTTLSPAPTASPITLTGLTPATNYTVTLQATCAGSGTVSSSQTLTVGTRPSNATVATAEALTIGSNCQPTAGNNLNAYYTNQFTFPILGCNTGFATANGVWYTFTTAATGPTSTAVRLQSSGRPANALRVFTSANGTAGPFTQLICTGSVPTATTALLDLTQLTPSTTYYVLAAPYSNAAADGGPFTICVSEPPACGTPGALSITNITNTTADVVAVAGTPAPTGYRISVQAQGSSAAPTTYTLSGSTGQLTLTGLTPGTPYTVTLTADCGGSLSLPLTESFHTTGPPINDLCTGALTLSCGQPIMGFNTSATTDAEAGQLCTGTTVGTAGVWYRFVGTGDDVTFSTCNSPAPGQAGAFEHRLHVFTGACGALSCVVANSQDGTCQTGSNLSGANIAVATTAGTVYYVLISALNASGTSNPTGDFELQAICRPAGSCPPPTNVQFSVNASGIASVSFTPAPGATHTTVNYHLADGTGFNYGANYFGSPVGLSSTRPNQQYVVVLSSNCGSGSRSVPVVLPLSTVLSSRPATPDAGFVLYPNPARLQATLQRPAGGGAATATLYNALGQAVRVLAVPAGASENVLDLRGLATGTYLLRLHDGHHSSSRRLSIE